MAWYNPFSWLDKSIENFPEDEIELLCMNPQCANRVIQSDIICYAPNLKEIYHLGNCALLAQAHRSIRAKEIMIGDFEYISRREAEQIIKDKEKGLEEKLG